MSIDISYMHAFIMQQKCKRIFETKLYLEHP